MHLIISTTSMIPIYEQIIEGIKNLIRKGELKENDVLPSVRSLARELKISALTVKKAYDELEEEGLVMTIHGKGSYISFSNRNLLAEEMRKELENDLELAVAKGRKIGLSDKEISDLFQMILEETNA